jgi:hypothetical protein
MQSSNWKQLKQQFLSKFLKKETDEKDIFFKVEETSNQNKKYATSTPWTTLIKDSSLVNSRVFVRESYSYGDFLHTDDALGSSILGCAVRKALRIVSEDSDKSDSEIFESMRDLALEYGQSGKTVIQVVKFLRSIDSDEIK